MMPIAGHAKLNVDTTELISLGPAANAGLFCFGENIADAMCKIWHIASVRTVKKMIKR